MSKATATTLKKAAHRRPAPRPESKSTPRGITSLDCLVFVYENDPMFGPFLVEVFQGPEEAQAFVDGYNMDEDREKTAALGAAVVEAVAKGNFDEVFRPELLDGDD